MRDKMDIRQLQYFVTIVQEGNISKAAKELHITQPPLSHAIKMLEQELNTTLFIRGSRNITLTESGKVLYSKAIHLIELHKQSIKEINDLERSVKGNLSFGCVSSAHMILMEYGVLPFYQKNSQITYELFEKNTYELIELLSSNLIEFALIRTPFSSTNLEIKELIEDKMVVVYHQEKYHFDEDSITLKNLKDKPLILYRRFYNIISSLFQDKMIHPNVICNCDDARTAILWASKKMGIAITPLSATKYIQEKKVKYIPIQEANLSSNMVIIYKKNHYLSKLALEFIDNLKKNIRLIK